METLHDTTNLINMLNMLNFKGIKTYLDNAKIICMVNMNLKMILKPTFEYRSA